LPLCAPILASVGLFYALDYWNNYLNALLFIDDTTKYPLQLLLRRLIDDLQAEQTLFPAGVPINIAVPGFQVRMATTAVTIGPIVLLYPLLQRYFVKGITLGAVKE
jgi:putative aldouronate transport system permease protein